MTLRLVALTILMVCIISHVGCGKEQESEEELERLVQQSPKLYLPKLIDFTEAKLERVYQAKLDASDPAYRKALQRAQAAWREYYKADRAVGALEARGGSGEAIFAMQRRVYQLRLRIYQLNTEFTQGWIPVPKTP